MEVVVDSVADHQSIDSIKLNEVAEKPSSAGEDVCERKSNGVVESVSVVPDSSEGTNDLALLENSDADVEANTKVVADEASEIVSTSEPEPIIAEDVNVGTEVVSAESTEEIETVVSEVSEEVVNTSGVVETLEPESKNCHLNDVQMEEVVESEILEPTNDNVRFETEIVVETNDNDVNEVEIQESKAENESPNNILSELGQNIELSEVLRSSDVTENVENNNCPVRQEVFNKEELLDILEGNDVQPAENQVVEIVQNDSLLEAQLALEQISRLKNNRKHRQSLTKDMTDSKKKNVNLKPSANKEESIVTALVKDWDDDEPTDESNQKTTESLSSKTEQDYENIGEIKEENIVDSSTADSQILDVNKSTDDSQPQRRLGRVIKKKVIFDPDNPDTFTKSKTLKIKDIENEKDQHQPKKAKLEQISLRAKSKSPVSKLQWKKPTPKNSKQNKRLTEVDKLLMDEGAVNMIYQLTPEAPKGKKNMKTKAEFIKKLQSSTPESKEMKFRERKKEFIKSEEGEAKKILGGKQRSSLNSSVKSPSVNEDFETHSADDSIIYRRHSSSSYSSSCMSPRRLSDVDGGQGPVNNASHLSKDHIDLHSGAGEPMTDVFHPDSSVSSEIINKDDCLSIKKKLNSKLSLALNKRKRESGKTDKPLKKKVLKTDEQEKGDVDQFKFLSLSFDQRVAEICIRKSGSKYNVEVLKEMEDALAYVDTRKDVSLTLLTSECGSLCSDLDLSSLLDVDVEKRRRSAAIVAESIRSAVAAVSRHSKALWCGVWAACSGVALALLAASDAALAAERASFALSLPRAPPAPAVAALRARGLPHNVVNDLIVFGRQLSAAEAHECGLVTRVLWPGGVTDQIQAIVKDIAKQSPQTLQFQKHLLKLDKTPESTFLSQLESEVALMVDYWTSEEGQSALRSYAETV